MGTTGSKKVKDIYSEPRRAFSDDDIFRQSFRNSFKNVLFKHYHHHHHHNHHHLQNSQEPPNHHHYQHQHQHKQCVQVEPDVSSTSPNFNDVHRKSNINVPEHQIVRNYANKNNLNNKIKLEKSFINNNNNNNNNLNNNNNAVDGKNKNKIKIINNNKNNLTTIFDNQTNNKFIKTKLSIRRTVGSDKIKTSKNTSSPINATIITNTNNNNYNTTTTNTTSIVSDDGKHFPFQQPTKSSIIRGDPMNGKLNPPPTNRQISYYDSADNFNHFDKINYYSSYDFRNNKYHSSTNCFLNSNLPIILSSELSPILLEEYKNLKRTTNKREKDPRMENPENYLLRQYNDAGRDVFSNPEIYDNKFNNERFNGRVNVSSYIISPRNNRTNQNQSIEQPTDTSKALPSNAQDDANYNDIKTLANILEKTGTREYQKFCSFARANSVDLGDVYMADFLKSLEFLHKLTATNSSNLSLANKFKTPSPVKVNDKNFSASSDSVTAKLENGVKNINLEKIGEITYNRQNNSITNTETVNNINNENHEGYHDENKFKTPKPKIRTNKMAFMLQKSKTDNTTSIITSVTANTYTNSILTANNITNSKSVNSKNLKNIEKNKSKVVIKLKPSATSTQSQQSSSKSLPAGSKLSRSSLSPPPISLSSLSSLLPSISPPSLSPPPSKIKTTQPSKPSSDLSLLSHKTINDAAKTFIPDQQQPIAINNYNKNKNLILSNECLITPSSLSSVKNLTPFKEPVVTTFSTTASPIITTAAKSDAEAASNASKSIEFEKTPNSAVSLVTTIATVSSSKTTTTFTPITIFRTPLTTSGKNSFSNYPTTTFPKTSLIPKTKNSLTTTNKLLSSLTPTSTTTTTMVDQRILHKCCCFCEITPNPVTRIEKELLSESNPSSPLHLSSPLSWSQYSEGSFQNDNNDDDDISSFNVDFFYVERDSKKQVQSFEEVLKLKKNKRATKVQTRPTSAICSSQVEPTTSPKNRPSSIYIISDVSDRYIPVAKLNISKKCMCETQVRKFSAFLQEPNCCLAEMTITNCVMEASAVLRLSLALQRNEGLKSLTIKKCKLGNDGCMFLSPCLKLNSCLNSLCIPKNEITSLGVKYLCRGLQFNKGVRELNLDENNIGNKGCFEVARLLCGRDESVLMKYNLRGKLASLKRTNFDSDKKVTLDLTITSISNVFNAPKTTSAVTSNKTFTTTTTTNNKTKLNQTTIKSQQILKSEPSKTDRISTLKTYDLSKQCWLRKLSLRNTNIDGKGGKLLFAIIQHCCFLTELDLSENNLGDGCVEKLGQSLLFNRSLKSLKLENCGLTKKSCSILKRPLKTNTDLSVLSLDLNSLEDDGVAYLVEGLNFNRTLRELSLNNCGVTTMGLESLLSVLKSRTSMRTVKLCYNNIELHSNGQSKHLSSLITEDCRIKKPESKADHNMVESSKIKATQAMKALDDCLYDRSSEGHETSVQPISLVAANVQSSFERGLHTNNNNTTLYVKMMMALKRNPSLRLMMWGNRID